MEHNVESIRNKIYEIRGQRVMLDFDLAELYGVETRALNQAVKRNIERFPEDFMFQLTKGELEILTNQILRSEKVSENTENISKGSNLISQIVISRFLDKRETKHDKGWGGSRKLPYAFTENGVAMLSSVLRSSLAIQINIGIMRTFTEFRKIATSLQFPDYAADVAQLRKDFEELKLDIEDILHDQNDINESTRAQLDAISEALAELQPKEPKPRRRIGFMQDQ
ncbi:ORF6N domain-containing protein [Prevotella sp. tf2-5]|uniref:ORF6N domain-containing protein n=1 Tax=Prevotella sp. tf2-5 TaxID=1761889 RepID=UPI0008E8BF7D|nr:ORF6N domain-containing protein [Prevotella sp. tf2-5]SFO51970.1 ORF6N domain-containing protein [Prevotella sp. tf2-5]